MYVICQDSTKNIWSLVNAHTLIQVIMQFMYVSQRKKYNDVWTHGAKDLTHLMLVWLV